MLLQGCERRQRMQRLLPAASPQTLPAQVVRLPLALALALRAVVQQVLWQAVALLMARLLLLPPLVPRRWAWLPPPQGVCRA